MNKNSKLILLCVTILFISMPLSVLKATTEQPSPQAGYTPFPDEEKIMTKIKEKKLASPLPLFIWQLSRIRLKHAAELYKEWKQNNTAEDFQRALVYAESATELSPDWDEAWLLLGMLYSEMKATPAAMERAADVLVKAVDVNPSNGRAQLLLAQVLMEQGRYWSAIEQYKMLIENSEAMRTGTVLSQLTFCYIADGRVQAGLDYLSNLPDLRENNSSKKPAWNNWKEINQAVLMKAKGDEKADDHLRFAFFQENPSLTVRDEYERYAKYLLTLWEKEAQHEKID
jgi:lipopolysaccharide biosynthesis regulator YciM